MATEQRRARTCLGRIAFVWCNVGWEDVGFGKLVHSSYIRLGLLHEPGSGDSNYIAVSNAALISAFHRIQ
ncbi:hypothetical protein LINPERPRIM_LOCUS4923, partial [Linum perenne]